MMKTNWHHDAAQEQGESIPSVERTGRTQRAAINHRGGLPLTITLDF
jgi:hypothetical protein